MSENLFEFEIVKMAIVEAADLKNGIYAIKI